MSLKRDRSESATYACRARKRQRLLVRLPTIPTVKKEEESFVVYNHLDNTEDLYEDSKDEEWKYEEDESVTFALHTPKTKRPKIKKETSFRNIFWGTQQSAWMGSVRVKGVVVRSCSRKSDVLAAKILNTRCRSKGIPPPNPQVGFLASDHLCSSVKKKSNGGALGKQSRNLSNQNRNRAKQNRTLLKKPRKKAKQGPRSSFKNIFWGTQQKAWMGNIRVRGTIVRSCSRKSDVQAAKILNSRCREKGIKPPNPEVGFVDSKSESKYLSGTKNRKLERSTHLPVSGQYISSERVTSGSTCLPLRTVKDEKNVDFFSKSAFQEKDKAPLKYQVKVEPEDKANLEHRAIENSQKPTIPDFYIKTELPALNDGLSDDFHDMFKNDLSTCRSQLSLETVEIPPPPVVDDVDFRAMNSWMFQYISDMLPDNDLKHQDRLASSLFDDLPLHSIVL